MGDDIKMGKGQSGEKGLKERTDIIGLRRERVFNRRIQISSSLNKEAKVAEFGLRRYTGR